MLLSIVNSVQILTIVQSIISNLVVQIRQKTNESSEQNLISNLILELWKLKITLLEKIRKKFL